MEFEQEINVQENKTQEVLKEINLKDICATGSVEDFKEFFNNPVNYLKCDYYRDLAEFSGIPLLVRRGENDIAIFALSQMIKLNLIPNKLGVAKSYLLAKMLESAGMSQNIEFFNYIYDGKMEQYLKDNGIIEKNPSFLSKIKNILQGKPSIVTNARDKNFKCGFDLLKTVSKFNNKQIFDMVYEAHIKYNKLSELEKFYLHGLTELTKSSPYVKYVDSKIGFNEKMLKRYNDQIFSGHYA